MDANHTSDLVKLPKGKKPISCKWVYKIKRKVDGRIDRYKARLVARGFSQKVGEDYEALRLNTAISALMIFVKKIKEDGFISREELRQFLIILNPLAPHITSEMYERVFGGDILTQSWPKYDETKLVKSEVEIAVQVNSKIVARVNINTELKQDEILMQVKANENVAKALAGKTIVKEIYVPGRIANIIAK